MAPPASFNVQEVPREKRCATTPLRVRVMGGGGDGLRGVWLVGGGGRGGGEMVLGSGGEGRMVFAGDGFAFCFRLVFLSVYIQKKTVCLFHCLKSKL